MCLCNLCLNAANSYSCPALRSQVQLRLCHLINIYAAVNTNSSVIMKHPLFYLLPRVSVTSTPQLRRCWWVGSSYLDEGSQLIHKYFSTFTVRQGEDGY